MITDSEMVMDDLFLSYNKILKKLKMSNIKTASNKEITYSDLMQACRIMQKKHPSCRWKFTQKKYNKYYILIEGYYWLTHVYFQREKSQIDADIIFFEKRIKQYEELLHIQPKKFIYKDMNILELPNYFNKTMGTIENGLTKMKKETNGKYRYTKNNKMMVSNLGIEWLCKNCFKQKYLEMLEEYKMELTEKYMEAGYPYDNF